MRILIFSTAYLPLQGGAELAVKEVTDRLSQHDFALITARLKSGNPRQETIGNVTVHRVGFGHRIDAFLLPIIGAIKAVMLNSRSRFDLTWSIMASQASIAAAWFSKLTGCPLVLTLQEGDKEAHLKRYVAGSNFMYRWLIQPLHHLVFHQARHITAISSYLKMRAMDVVPQTDMSVIPNGVDVDAFSRDFDSEAIQSIRRQFASQDQTLVISTSRLVKKNGIGDLIGAFRHLPERFRLVVLGDGRRRDYLEQKVAGLGLGNRVHLIGEVDFDTVPQYLAAADIFARPSRSEGMGNSFIEAMAAGLPVVATPVGGIVDFLTHEETGLFAEINNPQSVAEQIRRLDEDDPLRSQITKKAFDLVTAEYTWDSVASDYDTVFNKLVS